MIVASHDGRTLFTKTTTTSFYFHAWMTWLLVVVAIVGFMPRFPRLSVARC
jgi:hypothetical protein